jgi:hypothetical protein
MEHMRTQIQNSFFIWTFLVIFANLLKTKHFNKQLDSIDKADGLVTGSKSFFWQIT